MTIGKRVRQRREKVGLTQDQLAADSGVSQTQISEIENGKTLSPSIDTMQKLAGRLGVSIDWLAGGVEAIAATSNDGEEAPPFWAEFLAKYEFVSELSALELQGVRGFAGRQHRVTSHYDYVTLAEWYRGHRNLEDFERIRAEEEPE